MTLHEFVPTEFHHAFGQYPPVLAIASGDSVRTTTLDAAGIDHRGQKVVPRGNPLTGPFYVEGAEAGDTLAVHLESLMPNRTTGWTRNVVSENVVDPPYVRELPASTELAWSIDMRQGTAVLLRPESEARVVVPLAPMLGCLGVAPDRDQSISSATSAQHGGNMDYRGCRAGATIYFPVFVPGALLYVGDGHAAQGDGEIVGTGIETSFEVQFTVRLAKGKTIRWPRGEDDEYIFTLGNARPLDQALQHATTEMLRWLQQDYGLDVISASALLGQRVEYQVGNVYDPAYTVVCKVRKDWLSTLRS